MKHHYPFLCSKLLLCWLILLPGLTISYCPPVMAITPTHKQTKTLKTTKDKIQPKKEPIYLLDWQDNRISTTAGVFMVDDEITIIDDNNVKDSFSMKPQRQTNNHKLHRVILKKDGRRLVQITIK